MQSYIKETRGEYVRMNYYVDEQMEVERKNYHDVNEEKFIRACISPFSPTKIVSLDTDIKLALGNNRFICYNVYEGVEKFHIRQFEALDDVLIPSKLGICMNFECFTMFLMKISEIDECLNDLAAKRWVNSEIRVHGNVIASIKTGLNCVYLHKVNFANSKDDRVSTGIALRLPEWDMLKMRLEDLFEMKSELQNCRVMPS